MVVISRCVSCQSLLLIILCWMKGSALNVYPNKIQAEWIIRDDANLITPKRSGHVAFQSANGRLFVFGGYAEEDDVSNNDEDRGVKRRYVTNDLWEWTDTGWAPLTQKGDIPGPRLVSACGILGNSMYLLGGWDPQDQGTGGIILDTVHKLDLESLEWKHLHDLHLPGGPTSRHVCLKISNEKLLIHTHRCHQNQVILFDGKSFHSQSTTGDCPSSRGLHSATVISENDVLFFAGAAQEGTMSNECFVLCTKTWEWTRLQIISDDQPSPRASPCLCCYDSHCAIAFGGASRSSLGLEASNDVWALHIDSNYQTASWELLSGSSPLLSHPPARNAATLNHISTLKDGTKEYLLHGGWAPFIRTYTDAYILRIRPL